MRHTQSKETITTELEKGIYLLRWVNGIEQKTTKIVEVTSGAFESNNYT